jgi:flavin reductase (DIM6/NTAB) family NADH-FMN oxidoreductase RutF
MNDAEKNFQHLVNRLDYPLFVVTAAAGEERDGCLIGFATQCSIHPPLFLVCLSDKNRTYRVAQHAEYLVVHDIPDDRRDLAELFGGETADDDPHKLDKVDWTPGPGGAPIVAGLDTWFAGKITERLNWSGDHMGFVLEPVAAEAHGDEQELTFQEAKDIKPGHEP